MMKICPNCGNSVSDDATFCNNCGASLSDVKPQADQTQGQPAGAPLQQTPVAPQVMQQGAFNQAQGQGVMPQPYVAYDPKDHTSEFDPKDIADNKIFAVVPYLFSFVVGIIAGIYVSESQFLKFHIKNALRLDIASVLVALLFIIPVLGWIAGGILVAILFVVKIIAIVQAFSGKAKELPIISSIGFLK